MNNVCEKELFSTMVENSSGLTKVKLECWVEFVLDLTRIEYDRYISGLSKKIKNYIYNQKNSNSDNFEYFVDLEIRKSPSKTAFLAVQLSLIRNKKIININQYPIGIQKIIESEKHLRVFFNDKKRKG